MTSGKILWTQQVTPNDVFVIGCKPGVENCPDDVGPDFDFGRQVRAVVVHDERQRDLMMDRGPRHTRSEVSVAVADDGQAAELLVRERRADRGRRVVPDVHPAAVAVVAIVRIEVEQSPLPVAGELVS